MVGKAMQESAIGGYMGKDLRGKKLGKGIVQRKDGTYCARAMVNGETICLYGNFISIKPDMKPFGHSIIWFIEDTAFCFFLGCLQILF